MKICKQCGEELPLDCFYKSKQHDDGYRNECIHCKNSNRKPTTIEVRRKSHLKMYGLTPESYAKMLTKQEGKCAICEIGQNETRERFSVDHDHETGKVRALLCRKCNSGIGLLKDSSDTVLAAYLYLKKHGR